jgi:hypothetical protein
MLPGSRRFLGPFNAIRTCVIFISHALVVSVCLSQVVSNVHSTKTLGLRNGRCNRIVIVVVSSRDDGF